MKTNSLLILVVIFLLAVGTSVWLVKKDTGELATAEPLLGEFAEQLAKLDHVELKTAEGVLFTAIKKNQQWYAQHLSESAEFPVEVTKLSGFVGALQNANLSEAKTQNPQNYSRLGVQSIDQQNAASTLLILGADDARFTVLLGNDSANGLGTFIRQPEQQQSWLLDEVLNLPTDAYSWLKNPVLELELADINSVQRSGEDGWMIRKNDQQGLELQSIADNESLKYPTVVDNSLTAMLTVQFEQAVPTTDALPLENKKADLVFETVNGGLTISVFENEEQYYVTYQYPKQQWLSDWVFSVSSFNSGQLTKSRSDFVDIAEESEPAVESTESGVSQ